MLPSNQGDIRYVALWIPLILSVKVLHVIYVTWAGVICLTCMHEHEGAQHPRASADISGKSRLHMLHMLCNNTKIALQYIGKDGAFDYGI